MSDVLRERLTEVVSRIERRLGGRSRVLSADYVSVDLANPGALRSWSYQAEIAFAGGRSRAESTLQEIAQQFAHEGWRATDRSSESEAALQLSQDGFNIAVTTSRDGRRIIVGGSTPAVPADQVPLG